MEQQRESTSRNIHERWQTYLAAARNARGPGATFEDVVKSAGARWRDREPPELAFVADEILALLKAERHDSLEAHFLERAELGEVIGLRDEETGDVMYVTPEHLARVRNPRLRPYDPLLERVLRAGLLNAEVDALAETEEERET